MQRILIAGAGGAPSEGIIYSLLKNKQFEVVGMGADITDLICSRAPIKKLVPYANADDYKESLESVLDEVQPDFIHFQNDSEIYVASKIRKIFDDRGIKYFLPKHDVIDTCVHKYKSYLAFSKAGVQVPKNLLIQSELDLKQSFADLGDENGTIWLRSSTIGGGGKGSLSTSNFDFAKSWITANNGWGSFIAAEMLSNRTVTWQSIWHKGNLIVAQTRRRNGWIHGDRSISGITGVTKVGTTTSDMEVDQIAINSIFAVDSQPHGLYGVDMTYDKLGIPNPTEINIARFFTTIRFFTESGLNMPEIYVQLGLGLEIKDIPIKINPLPNNLSWLRGMDREPLLISEKELMQFKAGER
jgi:hypothetical protein